MTKRNTRKSSKFVPADWQWDASKIAGSSNGNVQMWSASGTMMGVITLEKARELVSVRAYFIGSDVHICQAT